MTPEMEERLRSMLLSGGLSGAVIGSGASALGGAKKLGQIAKAGSLAGLAGAGIAAGSGLIGETVMGAPDPDDSQGFTTRGGVGGAIGGGLAGAGLGALMGFRPVRAAVMTNLGRGALAKGIGKIGSPGVGAAALGTIGAAAGGFQGADEGMQLDFLNNMDRERKRKVLMEALQG